MYKSREEKYLPHGTINPNWIIIAFEPEFVTYSTFLYRAAKKLAKSVVYFCRLVSLKMADDFPASR
jgi:hypothetical protein